MGIATGQSPREVQWSVVVPAAATATTETTALGSAPFTGAITAVTYIPDTDITGVNTNTRKVSVQNRGAAGSGTTEMAALQFNSGINGTAFDEKTITLHTTTANRDFAQGDVLAWKSEAVGLGLVDPGGTVIVTLTRD